MAGEISLELLTTDAEFHKMVLDQIRDKFNAAFPKIAKLVQRDLRANIARVFVNSPEYQSMLHGPLNAHFGFKAGDEASRLDDIIMVLANQITVTSQRVSVRGGNFTGGLRVTMFDGTFEDLLKIPSAFVQNKGEALPWLEWLLLKGDQIIFADYTIDFGRHPRSRSGEAIMIKEEGAVWRVPPGVSGTINNNWITRAVNKSLDFINRLIIGSVERHLNKVI